MAKLRAWAVMLMAVLVVPVGPAIGAAAHAASDHDHHDEVESHHALEAVIHGHAHEDGVPPHEHYVAPAAQGGAARAMRVAPWRNNVAPVADTAATAGDARDLSRFSPLIEGRGAGPPSLSRRSTVLRI